MKFDEKYQEWNKYDIHPLIKINLKRLRFVKALEVQSMTLPYCLNHRDVFISARTGSGKTLAFGLPVINHILNQK
jgi:superfamily II DNA/RNA helicase